MKRFAIAVSMAALSMLPMTADAQLVRSVCQGAVHPSGPHSCTFILAGPVTGTATASPGPDGVATVRLVLTADPRSYDGSRLMEPIVLASCEATSSDGPATCSIDYHAELRTTAPYVLSNYNGVSLPGRCTATGSGAGDFGCLGGTV